MTISSSLSPLELLRSIVDVVIPDILVIDGLEDPHYKAGKDLLIGVHSGVFHADDIVFAALAAMWNETLHPLQRVCVIRTRDAALLSKCDIVGDVGGGRFDHHFPQTERKARVGEVIDGVTHSAASLLAKELGLLATPVFTNAMAAIAAQDNGEDRPASARCGHFDFVHAFNPPWNSEDSFDGRFELAMTLALPVLQALCEEAAAEIEAGPYLASLPTDQELVEIKSGGLHWQETLVPSKAKLILYPGTEGDWRVQAVPPEVGSFAQKLPIENPRKGDTFVFQAGTFLAGWRNRDEAIAAAEELLGREVCNG